MHIIVHFIIQKLKNKQTFLKKYTNWESWEIWNLTEKEDRKTRYFPPKSSLYNLLALKARFLSRAFKKEKKTRWTKYWSLYGFYTDTNINFQGDSDSQNKTLCSGKVHSNHHHQSRNLDCWSHHCNTHLQLMDFSCYIHQYQVGYICILSNDFLVYMIHNNPRHQNCILDYLSHHHNTHHQSMIHVNNLEFKINTAFIFA